MAGETVITVIGNLTADPELRFTNSGVALASFTIASTPRTFDRQANEWKDGETLFLRCTAWRELAENVANSLTKGTRVVAQGTLRQNSYQTKEGEKRSSIELTVEDIGPSLLRATAQIARTQARGQGGGFNGGGGFGAQPAGQPEWGQPAAPVAENPWGQPAQASPSGGFGSGFDDEQPF